MGLLIGAISNTEAHRENYRNTERYGTYQSSYYGNLGNQNRNNRDHNRNRYDVNHFDRNRSSWTNGYYNRPGTEFHGLTGDEVRSSSDRKWVICQKIVETEIGMYGGFGY